MQACANCDATLADGQRFCGACGQRTAPARLTLGQVAHDFLHALTHVDHGILALIKSLAIRPGRVAREYVEGRRKKHFGPLAFLVLSVGAASFMIVVTGVQFFTPISDSAAGFLQRHINLVFLMQMPLLAAYCTLLFWTDRLNYAEHLVLAAYASGFRILVLGLVATPVIAALHTPAASPSFIPYYWGAWLAYFTFAATQFYRGKVAWVAVRALVAAVLGQITIIYSIYAYIVVYEWIRAH